MGFLDDSLEFQQFLSQFGYRRQSFLSNDDFSLELIDLNEDHSDVIFEIFYGNFRLPEDIFLNVGLFIEDAELIVSVNELDTSVVSILTSLLILEPEVLHVLL